MFLRQTSIGREPLAVAMSGVRMGERVLQIGIDDPLVMSLVAAKPGLSGESSLIVGDDTSAVRARRAITETGALVNVRVHPVEPLPFDDESFDVVVVHNRNGQLTTSGEGRARTLDECHRVLRPGGRVVVFDKGDPSGLSALFKSRADSTEAEATVQALEGSGFRAVRILGNRDGYKFIEGLKVHSGG